MLVTVVIPTFNVERYIAETMRSVVGQTHTDWETVVVDDGSTDNTVSIVASINDSRVRVIQQANQGGAAARERGFDERNRSSDAVIFFDHDDRLRATGLASLVTRLTERPDCVASHGLAAYMDERGKPQKPGRYESYLRRRGTSGDTTFDTLSIFNHIPIGAILIRSEAKLLAGKFDPKFKYAHDWEYWLRLSMQGPIAFTDQVIYDYRVHSASMSQTSDRFAEDDLTVWAHYIKDKSIPEQFRRRALTGFRIAQARQLRRKGPKAVRRLIRLQFAEARRIWKDATNLARTFDESDII